MVSSVRSGFRLRAHWSALWRATCATEAAQIVELAVTLPLMVAIFVGIYDFGQAFNIKQKLSSATREGARFASNQSTIDLTNSVGNCSAPASICAVRDVVDAYLVSNNIDDCGLSSASVGQVGWTWTFTASNCSGNTLTLVVNRASTFTNSNTGTIVDATQVTLNYPYQWHFNRVVQFLVPGATFGAVTQIPTNAVMQNLN
jgi:Flp pilus assembly protein TadG